MEKNYLTAKKWGLYGQKKKCHLCVFLGNLGLNGRLNIFNIKTAALTSYLAKRLKF